MLIRILTEDKNHEQVRDLCSKRFESFTMLHGIGVWKGMLEPCLVIEIATIDSHEGYISDNREKHHATQLALAIKALNQQEAVLIEYLDSTNTLV